MVPPKTPSGISPKMNSGDRTDEQEDAAPAATQRAARRGDSATPGGSGRRFERSAGGRARRHVLTPAFPHIRRPKLSLRPVR